MNRSLGFIIINDFELRMIHAHPFAAQTRFAEHDQLLASGDHLLDVMEIEPSADQRLAQRGGVTLLEGRFENLLPTAKASYLSFDDFAAKTHRRVALVRG